MGQCILMGRLKKVLYIASGSVCVGLGVIGMFLPVLPTTPFLLLAAFLYSRGSDRFYNWLITNRWCGEYIRNYREGRGISRQNKVAALLLLWVTMLGTVIFAVNFLWLRILLASIAVAVTIHILKIKTYKQGQCKGKSCSESLPKPGDTAAKTCKDAGR